MKSYLLLIPVAFLTIFAFSFPWGMGMGLHEYSFGGHESHHSFMLGLAWCSPFMLLGGIGYLSTRKYLGGKE